jgi:uncharacterized OB-fold protein
METCLYKLDKIERWTEENAPLSDSVCGYCGNEIIGNKCSVCGAIHFPEKINAYKFKDFPIVYECEEFITAKPVF